MNALRTAVSEQIGRMALPGDNPGLRLTRYFGGTSSGEKRHEAIARHYESIESLGLPTGYKLAFDRWKAVCEGFRPISVAREFQTRGRMIVGLGAESVLEASIALNQPWGVPCIPGAALKGLAAHYLHGVKADGNPDFQRNDAPELDRHGKPLPPNYHGVLFGTTADAAHIVWHDAWLIPTANTAETKPFRRDVVVSHHRGYYGGSTLNPEPTDFDDPNPGATFLSAQGKFLICLQGPSTAWVDFAFDLLTEALENAGIGAKTHPGYGRLTPVTAP